MPEDNRTGEQIVEGMKGDRPWWKLTALDVAGWTTGLHPASSDPITEGMRVVGRPWDGRSDLIVGGHAMHGATLTALLDGINEAIAHLGPERPRLATAADVRLCDHLSGGLSGVVIDLDFGTFVLPVCIDELHFASQHPQALADAITATMSAVVNAMANRRRIEARETRVRTAFEMAVTRIGRAAAALWFRMEPVDVLLPAMFHLPQSYTWSVAMLDERLDWAPQGGFPVATVEAARAISADLRADHRMRARRSEDLRQRGLPGLVSDVAAALIEERGLDPSAIVTEARRRRRSDPAAGIGIRGDTWTASLAWRDGRLIATIMFDRGNYHDGELTVWGRYPHTLADGAPGRPLVDIVDHAAFRRAGCVIARAVACEDALLLEHSVRYRPPAARRGSALQPAQGVAAAYGLGRATAVPASVRGQ